jgi:GNAT superfamily N-acetyltransferase
MYFNSETGYISVVDVDPMYRNQGVGTALLEAALAWRAANGLDGKWKFHGCTTVDDDTAVNEMSTFYMNFLRRHGGGHGDGTPVTSGGYRIWTED